MKVSFELTMPNVGSWNGRWTGEGKKYYVIRTGLRHKNLVYWNCCKGRNQDIGIITLVTAGRLE